MTDALKKTVTDYALAMGFDLVRVTSAGEFVRDRDAALERINDGLMDGLALVPRGPGQERQQPPGAFAGSAVDHLLGSQLLLG